jgi:hypothetical protein
MLLTGCVFDPGPPATGVDDDGDGVHDDDDDTDEPIERTCSVTGDPSLKLCLEFEDIRVPMPTLVLDGSGNANDARSTAVSPTTREGETAIQLASQARLDVDRPLGLDDHVTIELFARFDQGLVVDAARRFLVDRNNQFVMSMIGLDLECGFGRELERQTIPSFDTTTWRHLACTVDTVDGEREVRVYIDGDVAECRSFSETPKPEPGATTIGARTNGDDPFVGSLDDVRIHDRALTAAEICARAGRSGCDDSCPSSQNGG